MRWLCALSPIVLATLSGCATPDHAVPQARTGTVAAVYVEVAPSIYVSTTLMGESPAHTYWARVDVADAAGAATTTMARVPARLWLTAGDTVAIDLGPAFAPDTQMRSPSNNRVVRLIAHRGTSPVAAATYAGPLDRLIAQTFATHH